MLNTSQETVNHTVKIKQKHNILVYLYGGDRARDHHLTSLSTGIVARKNNGGPRVGQFNRRNGDDVIVLTNKQYDGVDCFEASWGIYAGHDSTAVDPFQDSDAHYDHYFERVNWIVKSVLIPKDVLPGERGRSFSNPNDNGENARAIVDHIKLNCFDFGKIIKTIY